MGVDCPECLDRSEICQRYSGFFIVGILGCWRSVPYDPSGLQRML